MKRRCGDFENCQVRVQCNRESFGFNAISLDIIKSNIASAGITYLFCMSLEDIHIISSC